jgi:hypothetical protein
VPRSRSTTAPTRQKVAHLERIVAQHHDLIDELTRRLEEYEHRKRRPIPAIR